MSFISKYNEKIKDLLNTSRMVNIWRTKPVKVVFTNGCFDILHVGHVQYLVDAREAHALSQLPHLNLMHHKSYHPLCSRSAS